MSRTLITLNDLSFAVTSAQEMQTWDKKTAEDYGISLNMLMENAGREALHVLQQSFALKKEHKILVLCGSGNNGGDGAVLARYLHDAGFAVLVGHSSPLARYVGAAKFHVDLARKAGVNFVYLRRGVASLPLEFAQAEVLIDALIGSGFKNELRPDFIDLVNEINNKRKNTFIFSIDIPTGLNSETGLASPVAIFADACVAFEAPKPGLLLGSAQKYIGKLSVQAIGIPQKIKTAYPASFGGLQVGATVKEWLQPLGNIHKGCAGTVVVIGGSVSYTGAPKLTALAALRAGAGLVSVAAPAGICSQIKADAPDIMTIPLNALVKGSEDFVDYSQIDWHPALLKSLWLRLLSLEKYKKKPSALILGPGLGRSAGAADFMRVFFKLPISEQERPPLILDADALYHLDPEASFWPDLYEKDLITPHPGEAAYLLGCTVAELEADRPAALRKLCSKTKATVLLKGAGTLIAQSKASPADLTGTVTGTLAANSSEKQAANLSENQALDPSESQNLLSPLLISPYIEPNLAVGGSGDVLSGICGLLMSRSLPSLESAALAVQIHGVCGQLLRKQFPLRGNLASDIANMIPQALAEICKAN